jgi:alanyl-tRNA synthetase
LKENEFVHYLTDFLTKETGFMEKLYYTNQYEREFTAEVVNIIEKDKEFHIELDKTYFYPEGGGQPCDTGSIEGIPVTMVYEENGVVYHVTSKKPIKLHKLKCSVQWERRLDNMQQHLGQHILSAAFMELFNGSTSSFHLGKELCTIDIDKILTEAQVDEAERLANKLISDNIKVEFLLPTKGELKKLPIRKAIPNTGEQIRIVKIGDLDYNPCCGLHFNSTVEVQLIKIKKWEKYKNSTRIEFLCGNRAVNYFITRDKFASTVCGTLKCSEGEALSRIEKLTEDLNNIIAENKNLKSQVADYEIEKVIENSDKINDITIVKSVYNNVDLKYLNLIGNKLTSFENVIALLALKKDETANLLFMCSKNLKAVSMNSLLKDAITLIDGKGGGSDFSAQGGGKNNNNLESTLDYAFMKVNQIINSK